jgi:hypothetical protein
MKKNKLILSVTILLVTSLVECKPKVDITSYNLHFKDIHSDHSNDLFKHEINFKEVCNIMSAFLSFDDLRWEARHHTIGGFIGRSTFESFATSNPKDLFIFYPCYKNNITPLWIDEVFLCIYRKSVEDSCNLKCEEINTDLPTSVSNFGFKESNYDTYSISKYLLTMDEDTDGKIDFKKKADIDNYTTEFRKQYLPENGRQNDNCLGIDAYELLSVLNQEYELGKRCIGIRYFFAFEPANKRNVNRRDNIRIIIIGVKEDKSNYIYMANGNEALMMERDWPPDCD